MTEHTQSLYRAFDCDGSYVVDCSCGWNASYKTPFHRDRAIERHRVWGTR